jgi:phasin family protein
MFLMNEQLTSFFKNFQPANEQFTNSFKNIFSAHDQNAAVNLNTFAGNEQFTNAMKAGLDAQVSLLSTMAASTMTRMEKVIALNMSAAKACSEESAVILKQLLASKNPQEAQALLTALPQSTSAKAAAYGRHLVDIGSAAQAEFTRAAELQFADSGRKISALVDQAAKNLPAGSENGVAMAKAAIASANAGYEQFNKKAQQTVEALSVQVSNAIKQASEVTGQAAVNAGSK